MTDHIDTATERARLSKLAGHTPGPWFAGRDYEDGPFVAGGGYCLVNTVGLELYREPNARLIAAAPDLLATIHRLLDALDAERARAEKAEAALDHTQQWYAERVRKIEDVAKREGLWPEIPLDWLLIAPHYSQPYRRNSP